MPTITIQPHKKHILPAVRIPTSWHKAAGLLRHKRKVLELHLKQIHQEWDHKR